MDKKDNKLAKATKCVAKKVVNLIIVICYTYIASMLITSAPHGFNLHKGHLAGYTVVPGTGDSMEPTLNGVFSLMITKKTPIEDIEIGDVITYQVDIINEVGEEERLSVVHRVIGFNKYGIITKGDNNDWVDNWTVYPEDLSGKVEYLVKGGLPTRFEADKSSGLTYKSYLNSH